MNWYIADTSGGETYLVLAGTKVTQEEFRDHVLRALEAEDGDFPSSELTLHRMATGEALPWIAGALPPEGESWTTMFRKTLIGELRYVFPGEWELKEKSLS